MKNLTYETAFQLGLLKKYRYYVKVNSYTAYKKFLFIKYRKLVKWYVILEYRDISSDGYYQFDYLFFLLGNRIEKLTGRLSVGRFCDFELKEIKKFKLALRALKK